MNTNDSGLLELVLSASKDGLVDHDLLGGGVSYTERFWMLLGYDEPPKEQSSWQDLVHADDKARVAEAWREHVDDAWPFDETFRMQFFHGGHRWVRARGVVIMGEATTPVRAVTLMTDVTEQVAEAARHRAIVEAMPDTLVLMRLDGQVEECRPGVASSVTEVVGADDEQSLESLFGTELAQAIRAAGEDAARSKALVRREVCIAASTWFELSVSPAIANRLVVVIRDSTERKLLEAQLVQSQKLESIGQLAAGIAHEINTPLQYIGDNVRFLRKANPRIMDVVSKYDELVALKAPELTAELEKIKKRGKFGFLEKSMLPAIDSCIEGVERAAEVVSAMKYFSHPGSDDEKEPVDLNKAITATVRVSRGEWKDVAEVELELGDIPEVPCLAGPLKQCFLNLVINATHALGDEHGDSGAGRLHIKTQTVDDHAEVHITDNGPGIPDHVLQRIYDPFFTTKALGKGTGQGLALCRETIIDRHGGELFCETSVGGGTTFVVRLPLQIDATSSAECAEPPTAQKHSREPAA